MTRYLTEKEILLLNWLMIKKYTPKEPHGIKDVALFQSVVNRSKQSAFGEDAYPTIWEKAAALYASLCQNHSFLSANKRTGFAAMKQFLWVNGYLLTAPQKMAEDYTLKMVMEKPSIKEIAAWIEKHSSPRDL